MINFIRQDSKYCERRIEGTHYIVPYSQNIEGVIFEDVGIQRIRYGAKDGDELGSIFMENYIIINLDSDRVRKEKEIAKKAEDEKKIYVNDEVERIMEVIQIDKEDGFALRKERNLDKEVIEELRTKGLKVKTELWQDSRTGKNDRIITITW